MGGRKQRTIGRENIGDNCKDENGKIQLRAIKMTLFQALRKQYRKPFMEMVYKYCLAATRIAFIASHLFLFLVNEEVSKESTNFFTQDGKSKIKECFNDVAYARTFSLPRLFLSMMQRSMGFIVWPDATGMSRPLNSLIDQYETNIKNNLKVWYVSRIRRFLRMKCYEQNHGNRFQRSKARGYVFNETDVKNATKFLINQRDWTGGDWDRQV